MEETDYLTWQVQGPDFQTILVLRYRKTVLLHIKLCCDIISYDSFYVKLSYYTSNYVVTSLVMTVFT